MSVAVLLVFPGGGTRTTVELPGIPRRGDVVLVRWGDPPRPERYAVREVEWDVNEQLVRVHLDTPAPA